MSELTDRLDEFQQQLTEQIEDLSEAVSRWRKGRLSRRVLILLLRDQTGLGITQIEDLLAAMECLPVKYLKPLDREHTK